MEFLLAKEQIKNIYYTKDNSGCLASNRITVDGQKVGYMYREESSCSFHDSGWRFFSGDESDDYCNDPNNFHVFDLNTICNYDIDIIAFLDSPIGSAYIRSGEVFVLDE